MHVHTSSVVAILFNFILFGFLKGNVSIISSVSSDISVIMDIHQLNASLVKAIYLMLTLALSAFKLPLFI